MSLGVDSKICALKERKFICALFKSARSHNVTTAFIGSMY